jgi:hypothetical protein
MPPLKDAVHADHQWQVLLDSGQAEERSDKAWKPDAVFDIAGRSFLVLQLMPVST